MNANLNTMNRDDFNQLWERRKQTWHTGVPDDASILRMAERARNAAMPEENVTPINLGRRGRWIPYAAAASLVVGIAIYGLMRQDNQPTQLPVAKEVSIDGQTVRFLCNNGCSAQEVLLSANDIIKK